jgi:hypothetical protein
MLYLATDTNFHLHWPIIDDVLPAALGITETDVCWLIPSTVVEELDRHQVEHPQRRIRERAERAKGIILKAVQGQPLKSGIPVVHARIPANYAKFPRVNPTSADHRILAELLEFQEAHPNDEIVIVSADGAMFLRADDFTLRVIEPPKALRLKDQPTGVERRLEAAEAELKALRSAEARLELKFAPENGHVRDVDLSLTSQAVQRTLAQILARPDSPVVEQLVAAISNGIYQSNPNYEAELEEYRRALEDYLSLIAQFRGRMASFALSLANVGALPAEGPIHVDLTIPEEIMVSDTLLRNFEKPVRPLRTIESPSFARLKAIMPRAEQQHESRIFRASTVDNDQRRPHIVMSPIDGKTTVTYTLDTMAQGRAPSVLRPLYLTLPNRRRGGIEIPYQVTAANIPLDTNEQSLLLRLRWTDATPESLLEMADLVLPEVWPVEDEED